MREIASPFPTTKFISQMSHFCNIIFMMQYCYIHLVQ